MNTSSVSIPGAIGGGGGGTAKAILTGKPGGGKATSNEEFLNQKINFIQDHIEHLFQEITNLPAPWTYGVDLDGRIFFIK